MLTEGFVETSWFEWAQVCGKHAGDYFRSRVEIYCGKWSPVQAPWRPCLDGWAHFNSNPLVGAFLRFSLFCTNFKPISVEQPMWFCIDWVKLHIEIRTGNKVRSSVQCEGSLGRQCQVSPRWYKLHSLKEPHVENIFSAGYGLVLSWQRLIMQVWREAEGALCSLWTGKSSYFTCVFQKCLNLSFSILFLINSYLIWTF